MQLPSLSSGCEIAQFFVRFRRTQSAVCLVLGQYVQEALLRVKQFGKTNCIHLENDYLIYFDGAVLLGRTKLLLTMDSEDERAR